MKNINQKLKKQISILFFVILGVGSISSNVYSGGPSTKDLEVKIAELQRVIDGQSQNLASTLNQMQQVASQFQTVSGQVDQGALESQRQAKLLEDAGRRLDVLEEKNRFLQTQLEEIKSAGLMPVAQVKNFKDFQTIEKGLTQFNAELYHDAIDTLHQFVAENPKSAYIEQAQYWIGSSFYAMRDFPSAIAEFQGVVKKFPTGTKAPSALLKQGFSFYQMQAYDEAKAFLDKLVAKYPASNETILAKDKLKAIEAIKAEKEAAIKNGTAK